MAYRIVTMSNTGQFHVQEGEEREGVAEALRAFHRSTTTLFAGAMDEERPGLWLWLHSASPHLIMKAAAGAPGRRAPAPEAIAAPPPPKAKPGAAFHRRTAQIEASPGTFVSGKSADQVEELLRIHGERLSAHTARFLRRHANTLHDAELQEAAKANALPEEAEPARREPGAKFLRNQVVAAHRDAAAALELERQARADQINADPIGETAGLEIDQVRDLVDSLGDLLTDRTKGTLEGLAYALEAIPAASNSGAEGQGTPPAAALAPETPRKASRAKKSASTTKTKDASK